MPPFSCSLCCLAGIGITQANTKSAINGGLQIWNLLAAVTGAFLIDRLGRRTLFIISNVGMLIGERYLAGRGVRTEPFVHRLRSLDHHHRSFQRTSYAVRCERYVSNDASDTVSVDVRPPSNPSIRFHVLSLLRLGIHSDARRLYPGDPSIQHPCKRFRCHGRSLRSSTSLRH